MQISRCRYRIWRFALSQVKPLLENHGLACTVTAFPNNVNSLQPAIDFASQLSCRHLNIIGQVYPYTLEDGAKTPISLSATIEFLGLNTDGKDLSTSATEKVVVNYGGFDGNAHGGLTRKSCSRVRLQFPEGTEIRNTRQISAVSIEELDQVQQTMELDELDI